MQLLFLIVLNFYLINSSNKFLQRKLDEIPNIAMRRLDASPNKLMLVGFGNYSKTDKKFNIYFKNYNNSFSYNDLKLNATISYQNGQNATNIICTKTTTTPAEEDSIIYSCPNEYLNDSLKVKIIDDSYKFYKDANNISQIDIVESFLANTSKNDILSRNTTLDFITFYFNNISVTKNTATIKGNIKITQDMTNNTYILNSTEESYKCNVTNNEIKFNLTKTVKDNLIGNWLYNGSEPKILIFSNKTVNDLLLYSNYTYKKAIPEIIGYDNYIGPTNNTDAKNRVHFRGTLEKLKKYLLFTVRIKRSTLLRILENDIVVIAQGIRDDKNSDLNNGHFIYDVTFEKTRNMNIIGIEGTDDFRFSDDNNIYNSIPVSNFTKGNLNLTETKLVDYKPFNLNNPSESINKNASSFSFDIIILNDNKINIGDQASLSYFSLDDNARNETDQCSIMKKNDKNNTYEFKCSPKHDIYARFSSILIKIPNSKSRLRLLQTTENITQLYPEEQPTGNINYVFVPSVRTYKEEDSGLSGGAITAIVLCTVAAVAAIGALLFFLNRKGPAIKIPENRNMHESTDNINN